MDAAAIISFAFSHFHFCILDVSFFPISLFCSRNLGRALGRSRLPCTLEQAWRSPNSFSRFFFFFEHKKISKFGSNTPTILMPARAI
jgi:hypothetical protein